MTILWLILKIILWILVGLLSIFCLLLLGILFLPIIYEMEGEKWDTLRGKVRLNIFHVVKMNYNSNLPNHIEIRVLGFKLKMNPLENEGENLKNDSNKEKKEKSLKSKDVKKTNSSPAYIRQDKAIDHTVKQEKIVQSHESTKQSQNKDEATPSKKAVHFKKKQKSPKEQSKTSMREVFEEVVDLWHLEERPTFLKAFKRLLISWWQALKPYYLYFEVVFGLEDPSETGLWLAKLMTFYPFYGPYGQVIGNFEEQVLQGYIEIKGKTRLIKFLYPTLVFIAHKEVRIIIKKILNFGKDDKDGIKTQ